MTIARRLKIAALVPAFLAALIGVLLFVSGRMEERLSGRRTDAHRIAVGVNELNNFVSSFVVRHEDRPKQQFLTQHDAVAGLMNALDVESGVQRQVLADMRRDMTAAKGAFLKLVSHYANPAHDTDPLLKEVEERLRGQILIRCQSVVSSATRLDSLVLGELITTKRRTGIFVFILVAGAAGVLTLGSLRMMRRITDPLDRLRRGTEIIGSGDLTHRINLSSTDEIGRLGQAFDRMAEDLRVTTVSRDAMAAEVEHRKRTEEENQGLLATVQQERDRLSSLVSSTNDEIWFTDTDKVFTLVNPAGSHEFGLQESNEVQVEALAASLEVHRPDGTLRPVDEAPPLRALRGEVVRDQEEIIRTPATGELRHRQISAAPVRDAGGAIIGSVSVVRDITERKEAEESLRKSEERFRALVTASSEVLFSMSPDWSEMRQLHSERFLAQTERPNPTWLAEYVHPDDQPRVTAVIGKAIGTKSVFEMEHRVWRADGTIGWTFSRAVPLLDASGEIVEWFGSASDITERKRAEKALRELNATLEKRVEERTAELTRRAGQLQKLTLELSQAEDRERRRISLILHEDLQQQIAGARFHLTVLKGRRKEDSPQEVIDTIDEMLKAAIQKARGLSHDLSPPLVNVNDMSEVVEWVAQWARARHGLTVGVDVSGRATLRSEALTMFLFRAAQELLFNVVKHAQVKEASIRVRRIGHYIYLCVSDRGRGFEPHELKETAGLGLLSIRERVELLGGRMKIKSVFGQGSRCHIVVPDGPKMDGAGENREVEEQRVDYATRPSAVVPPPSFDGTLRVLLADDHQIVRRGLVALLRSLPDIEVVGEASNGPEAVKLALELRPDVVIMDMSMPLMSGHEATCQIKSRLPEIRIVALSMYEEPEIMERIYQAGVDSYVLKTAPVQDLLAAIRGRGTREQQALGDAESQAKTGLVS